MSLVERVTSLRRQSLFRNASLLILSTAIMSVLGFGFWLFVAHLYSPDQVGVASALIAVSTLLSSLSMVGLDSGLIRFLPGSKDQSRDVNAALIGVGALASIAALGYALIAWLLGAHLAGSLTQGGGVILFMLIIATVSLNSLTDSVFIANRRAEFHTIVYAVFGLVKLLLPIVLVGLGWLGIYAAYAIAALVGLALSFYFMGRIADYRLTAPPNWGLLSSSRKLSLNNYIGTILASIPTQLMPLIIIQRLGAADAAYFSMALTMANLLYVAPSSVAQSLLAESSHRPAERDRHARHAVKMLALILVPGVAVAVAVAPYLLAIFGSQYANGGTTIFQILAAGTFFVAIGSVCNAVLNIEHRSSGIVIARAVLLAVTLVLTVVLLPMGLPGVGIAIIGGYALSDLVYIYLFIRRPRPEPSQSWPIWPPSKPFDI